MDLIQYKPIGVIRSPFTDPEGTPIQPTGAIGIRGTVELNPEFVPGLKDLDGFSHIFLIYHLHLLKGYSLEVQPFMDSRTRGIFATRAPVRPNPIGLSVVRLIGIKGNILHIEDVDIVDKTPLLDIKPFVPVLDHREALRIGWFENNVHKVTTMKADKRFAGQSGKSG
ncbi:tRNA (N6-threonylcarbamoyladenosine(37)-N6)-methyltransferase TrmO [Desulfomonile tiedjei]|uniref:Putative methyltransferase, YaeB/AF_0241 family n=1 Tax=Desulfomonile tiedjei (strain ATCC 49306 / DSM 6799 / DCB-1) TaxID=706587 RepID=I4C544_DESTA|nr:tRNA (N6-threonylcarbamoyladenosine(37)-N6)-methyltransferase TrmO [Desulfomonile tiedjei]AFM24685.1 putative methyltransferase, YaeB/AF_0241 family [Desulfomonile tiedjei DSM 6799]